MLQGPIIFVVVAAIVGLNLIAGQLEEAALVGLAVG
jgi:hypothetical protein